MREIGVMEASEHIPPGELPRVAVNRSPEEKFGEFLEIKGRKYTTERRTVVRRIFDSHEHFDADQLVAEIQRRGEQVSRSTVYRTLELLVEAGMLRELRFDNRTAYEHEYGYPDHDHLYCGTCRQIIEFQNDELIRLRETVSRQRGFHPQSHRFVIYGTCAACSRPKGRNRRLDLV